MLEVGCGRGELARALAGAGYDVVAVDPEAPEGSIFRRTTIEELDEPGRFDAVVASFSLHHVEDLDAVLRKIHALVEGVLIADEFGWDLIDGATAERYSVNLDEWEQEHAELHGFEVLRAALGRHFEERHFDRGLYFARHLGADAEEEQRLIDTGAIRPLGFRFVGTPR